MDADHRRQAVRSLAAVISAGAVALSLMWAWLFSGIDEIFSIYGLNGRAGPGPPLLCANAALRLTCSVR